MKTQRAIHEPVLEALALPTRFSLRQFPPCLGCGRPVSAGTEAALTVNQVEMTATFRPCGCMLRIEEDVNDAMYAFARARLRDGTLPNHEAEALSAVLEETIWPFVGTDSALGRNATHALRLFVSRWASHPEYQPEWSP